MKLPDKLGPAIDLAYKLREARLAYQRKTEAVLEKMRLEEKEVEAHIINSFNKDVIEGSKGKLATASISRLTVAEVKNWGRFYDWIAKNKAWEMLQRRVNDKAYRERLDAKQKVPGVEPFVLIKLSLTKR
jgi:hypothetical protein